MASKKKATKKTGKTGEALRQEAIKEAEANIAKLEAEERDQKPTAPEANASRKVRSAKAKASKPKSTGAARQRKLSGLDAAAQVLAKAGEPLSAKTIAERAIALGWKTNGATPHATLYAAMIREVQAKGREARFKKSGRGLFTAGKKG